MNILIIGEWYSSNFGDGIICENVKKIVEEIYNKENVIIDKADISCRNGFLEERTLFEQGKIKPFLRKVLYKSEYLTYKLQDLKRKNKIKKVCRKKYDIAIFAGGHLIMPYFIFQIYDYIKYLSANHTPIIINACGVGRVKSKILKRKIKKTLDNKSVVAISSRDDINKLKKEYIKKEKTNIIEKTYDPAIYTNETYNISKMKGSNIIGLGVMKVPNISDEIVIEFWKGITNQLEEKNQKWQFFCNGSLEDYILACKCLRKIKRDECNYNKYIAKKPNNPKELVEIISRYKALISFRLHSHIVAYSLNIPSIAIMWDSKVKIFFEDIELEDRCFDITNKSKRIVEKLCEIKDVDYNQSIKDKQKKIIINNLTNNLIEKSKFINNF